MPDDYRIGQRILGLYPVSALAFYQGVLKFQANTRATFATPLADLPVSGQLIAYGRRHFDDLTLIERYFEL